VGVLAAVAAPYPSLPMPPPPLSGKAGPAPAHHAASEDAADLSG
jgi:hypothetical protein